MKDISSCQKDVSYCFLLDPDGMLPPACSNYASIPPFLEAPNLPRGRWIVSAPVYRPERIVPFFAQFHKCQYARRGISGKNMLGNFNLFLLSLFMLITVIFRLTLLVQDGVAGFPETLEYGNENCVV